jgi:hypothetical protein
MELEIMKTKPAPQIILDMRARHARMRASSRGPYSDAQHAQRIKAARERVAAYKRAKFYRTSLDISDIIRHGARGCDSLMDYENDMQESCDNNMWEYVHNDMLPDMEDARAVIEWAHDVPRAYLMQHAGDVRRDLKRAYVTAYSQNYAADYMRWLADSIAERADETGMRWCWLDGNGEPTTEDYEAERVGFACTRAGYLGMVRELDGYDSRSPDSYHVDNADENVQEFIAPMLRAVNIEHFDERGSRGADTDDWPDHLSDYSDTAETYHSETRKLRAKLKELIKARAPLHVRQAAVESVTGSPGQAFECDDE